MKPLPPKEGANFAEEKELDLGVKWLKPNLFEWFEGFCLKECPPKNDGFGDLNEEKDGAFPVNEFSP